MKPDSFNFQIRKILTEMIIESGKSRQQVAESLTKHTQKKISIYMMDAWTRRDSTRHIPLEYVFHLEKICNSTALTETLCKYHEGSFLKVTDSTHIIIEELRAIKRLLT